MIWTVAQSQIDSCRRCEDAGVAYLRVPAGSKRHPPYSPPEGTRIFFVSVAPPWGGDYFWDETKPDKVRQGLFTALYRATGENFSSASDFQSAGYFLVPGVKCPSEENNKDHLPHARAVNNCSSHLVAEMRISRPERILALGQSAMKAVSKALNFKVPPTVRKINGKIWWANLNEGFVPVAGTYFPGNNRHRSFDSIVDSIRLILELKPKPLKTDLP